MDGFPEFLSVGCIILAAGEGRRMGALKQMLPYGGGTMLWHVVDTALDAAFGPVVVVVGANADTVREALQHKDVLVAENPAWQSGMGSSIMAGLKVLQEADDMLGAAAILLADQPAITARQYSSMRTLLQSSAADAVAAEYAGTVGVPAIFAASCFPKLLSLAPESGAKHLLRDGGLEVVRFPLPEAAHDVDTPDDLAALS